MPFCEICRRAHGCEWSLPCCPGCYGHVEEEEKRLAGEINALRETEVLVETNQGTYGPQEAARKVGCGDPQFADRNAYETVGGRRHETGPGGDRCPGYMRQVGGEELGRMRRRLKELMADAGDNVVRRS